MTQILSSSTIHDPIAIPASVPDVVAIMTVHNEEDILGPAMAHLTNQGVGVYILDNWSTDSSAAMARAFEGRGLAGLEMFPATPASQYDQMACFKRKAEVALQLRERGARWIIHYDADELRDSPWPGVSLRDGLRRVESEGYNAVNHVLVLFVPTDEDFRAGLDPNVHFPFYIPSPDAPTQHQIKAWIQPETPVDLVTHAGHIVQFPGRRVYPIPFIIRHYPIRSTAHGRRKVYKERLPRYPGEEMRLGWHTHYAHLNDPAQIFIYQPNDPQLKRYDETALKREFLDRFYAPEAGSLEAANQVLAHEVEASRIEIARLRKAQASLRYHWADKLHGALMRTGPLYRALKKTFK